MVRAGVAAAVPAEVLAFRRRFSIFESKVHLATNAKGALADVVADANAEYLESWRTEGAPWGLWAQRHEELRAAFAKLIGAKTEEIAVCPAATSALGVLASCFEWREGRPAIAFDDYSFPSVTYLWHAQAQRGAEVRRVAPDAAGELRPEAFDPVLDEDLRLLSVAHVCYKNGHRVDLPALVERAHAVGALLVVDDYQSCGSRPLDVHAAGIDVLTAGTVKFMLGSPGVAFLYVAEHLHADLHPTLTGWFGQRNPGDFQVERNDEAPDAARFQVGTPAIPAVFDSLAGIELIAGVGLEAIGAWIDSLTALLIDRLDEEGFVPATPRDPAKRGPQVAIRTTAMDEAVAELAARGLIVSSRDDNIRVAFHYYNTPEDIEALIAALHSLGGLMVRR
ncbi:MAG: aminotransferase class V-fold PLP-dependent enzyme [Actinobacteria bacterium]|nr:aminotransferase class V-fold PLP-dependent enzyme [Actinomycetota bacterium]